MRYHPEDQRVIGNQLLFITNIYSCRGIFFGIELLIIFQGY